MVLGVFVEQVGGDGGLDDVLEDVGVEGVVVDGLGVLGGDDDGVDADGLVVASYSTVTWDLPSGRR